ncbi:eEF1A lysine and N-terminal methyltransferase [Strongylocentrotus purpuratus]|uniref:Methyltransferase type 11 domain-containing protein n=1 Tax=Strongylocentrotus purpuratus TaxID=7668 RepID=A0A7M7PNP4_STRPU|nr:eEF1A lysine and N-terminal methyltransferase [Strongylocentrotus purpuratus]
MDLLPKTSSDIDSAQYWESLLKKHRNQAFEWYGEYPNLCGILHKYIRTSDKTLVVGCGNSRLSEDLYDVGYHQLVNIDDVDSVVKQKTMKNAKQRPKMKFERMDVTQMTYEDSSFTVVLDRGNLDARMTDQGQETVASVEKTFGEIGRVLKVGGRYVCITLAQEHLIRKLLGHFSSEGWMVRIHKIDTPNQDEGSESSSPMPIFIVVSTKFKKMAATQSPILELSLSEGRSPERVSSIEDVMKAIKSQQDYAMLQHSLHKRSFCDESLSLDLYAPSNENPRFTLYIVDKPKGRVPANKFAIFIVPQGRETEYLFGTDRGRGQLADQAGFQRLVVVTLHRGHLYQSIDSIKTELSSKVMELKPSELPSNTQVPFLSIGEDVGDREVRYEAEGSHGNMVIVEDVRGEDGGMYRQIIFSSNPNIVQSQAKLVTEKPRSKSGKKRGKAVTRVDHLYLSMTFHRIMTAGLALIPGCLDLLRTRARGLLIGLGGGGLPMFLYKQFPKLELDVVELDPMLKDVAKSWFGLVEDERLRIHIQDGLDFIKSAAQKDPPSLYNVVLFDVDSKDSTKGLSCPPKAFVEPVVLERVKRILHPTQGIFILNFACRDDVLKESVMSEIQTHFPSVYTSPMEDDINEIVHCLPQRTSDGADKMKVQYRDGARSLQKYAKSVSSRWESDFDLCEIMDDLQIKDER